MSDRSGSAIRCVRTDDGYEGCREALVWQAIKPDRHPHAIWQIRSEADIVAALAEARSERLRVSVVSGGHSYIGQGVQDGTLLLDLSRLKGMEIDAANRIGWVEPGVRVAEFDSALERAGLAFPVGHDPNVGLVGFLLGGGMGWNPESWNGMSCFNVTAAEIVLASGETVVADASRHPDLFWAVRGAGPGFCGVVTRLHVQLFPRPTAIRKSDYVFSLDALGSVLEWLDRQHENLDDRLELSLAFGLGMQPHERQGLCTVSLIAFADTDAEAADLCRPYAQSAPVEGLVSVTEWMPQTFSMLLNEAKGSSALRRSVESLWTDHPYEAARDLAAALLAAPSPDSVIYLGLRKSRALAADAACSLTGSGFVFIDGAWERPADDADNIRWVDDVVTCLRPYDKGGYINETDWYRRPGRVARCYSTDAWQTLKDVNRRYDPYGMFVKPPGMN